MALILNGTDGLSDVDGSAATPAIRGTDTNTGIFFPAADTIAFSEGGTEVARFDSAGNLLVGSTSTFGSGAYGVRVSNTSTNGFGAVSIQGNRTALNETVGLFQVFNTSTEVTRVSSFVGANATSGVLSFQTASSGTLAEQARIDSFGNLFFNSGYGSAAAAYGCRAWVNFNGTGTVAIRGSGNVSSITDNGTGDYTVNFATAMPDANYSVGAQGARTDSNTENSYYAFLAARSTLSEIINVNNCRFFTGSAHASGASGVRYDAGLVTVQVFR
jgi:hypothetical protein